MVVREAGLGAGGADGGGGEAAAASPKQRERGMWTSFHTRRVVELPPPGPPPPAPPRAPSPERTRVRNARRRVRARLAQLRAHALAITGPARRRRRRRRRRRQAGGDNGGGDEEEEDDDEEEEEDDEDEEEEEEADEEEEGDDDGGEGEDDGSGSGGCASYDVVRQCAVAARALASVVVGMVSAVDECVSGGSPPPPLDFRPLPCSYTLSVLVLCLSARGRDMLSSGGGGCVRGCVRRGGMLGGRGSGASPTQRGVCVRVHAPSGVRPPKVSGGRGWEGWRTRLPRPPVCERVRVRG